MTNAYAVLEKKIATIPETYLQEIADYVDFIEFRIKKSHKTKLEDNPSQEGNADSKRREAAMSLAGLWKYHDNSTLPEEMVRKMRKGRRFDY